MANIHELPKQKPLRNYSKNRRYPPSIPYYPKETVVRTIKAVQEISRKDGVFPPPWLAQHTKGEAVGIFSRSLPNIASFLRSLNAHRLPQESLAQTLERLQDDINSIHKHSLEEHLEAKADYLIREAFTTAWYCVGSASVSNTHDWDSFRIGEKDINELPKSSIDLINTGTDYLTWEGLSGFVPEFHGKPNPFEFLYKLGKSGIIKTELSGDVGSETLKSSIRLNPVTEGQEVMIFTTPQDAVRGIINTS